jgi:hypothetical protein
MNSRPATNTDSATGTRLNHFPIGGGIGELPIDGTCLLKGAPGPNGEATFISRAVSGNQLQLGWDGLGLLKTVSDNGSAHTFTYAPSGMRVRDVRTGTNAIDKRYVYTTSGALMSVHETGGKRRDILYANGEAIAEIDQDGNIYELHNDHLGTPRYITACNAQPNVARGQLAGQQAFGPYGEEMRGTFNGQALPSGYAPITGYTGHLNEDLTGEVIAKPQKGEAKPTGQDVHVGRKTSNAAAKGASAVGLFGCLSSLKALRALSRLPP